MGAAPQGIWGMTTIATDGVTIAAESRATRRHEIASWSEEKVIHRHGRIYASSGSANIGEALVTWHQAGANPKDLPVCSKDAGGWTLLVIDADGMWVYNDEVPYRMQVAAPFTMGSGGDWAMGAMHAGASPRKAVEIACKL